MVAIISGWLIAPMVPVIAVVIGATLAYEGVNRQSLVRWLLGLVFLEVATGADFGTMSIAYVGAALTMLALQHLLVVGNWVRVEGWHPADAVRTIVVAVALAVLVMVLSTLTEALLYQHGSVATRLASVLASGDMLWLVSACTVVVIVLRRIDIPFMRHSISL